MPTIGRFSARILDDWAKGIGFVAKSGEAIYQGRTSLGETLSQDERLEILLKLGKLAGITLNPSPQFPTPLPLAMIGQRWAMPKAQLGPPSATGGTGPKSTA